MGARAASSILALLLALLPWPECRAQAPGPPTAGAPGRFTPSARFAEARGLSDPLGASALIGLGMAASLSDPESGEVPAVAELAAGRAVAYIEEKAAILGSIGSAYERGAEALAILHRERFREYRAEQTRIDLALDSGAYNCVSSAVIYIALAKAAGLEAWGVQTPDHAFAVVRTEKGDIDVETTNAIGFDPGKRKEAFTDSFGRITGYAYMPPEQYAKRSRVGDKAMAGLILHNRVSVLEADGLFPDAFRLALDRAALEGPETLGDFLLLRAVNVASSHIAAGRYREALAFLDAYDRAYPGGAMAAEARAVAIRNQLADYSRAGRYEDGYAFIEEARAAWGEQEVFGEFDATAVRNRSIDLMKAGEYGKALAFLDESAGAGRGKEEDYPGLRENAALGWINLAMRSLPFPDILSLVEDLHRRGSLSAARRKESLRAAAGNEANKRAKADPAKGWLAARGAFDAALSILPGDPDLAKGRQSCLDNYAASVYNRFVVAYNARRMDEAERILEEGLSDYPDSPLLKKHLAELSASRR